MSIRSILFVLLIASLLTNIALVVLRRRLPHSKDRSSTKLHQDVRLPPLPTSVSLRDLQDLREALETSFQKSLQGFGKILLAELEKRNPPVRPGELRDPLAPRPTGVEPPIQSREASPSRRRSMQQYVDEFCRGAIGNNDLISGAEDLGLRWGSATPKPGQLRVSVKFGNADSRIIVIEKERGGLEYFLVLKDDAFWNFDLELLFNGQATGGGRPPATRNNRTLTKKPSVGQLDESDELKVVEVGSVEVVEF